MWSFFFSFCVHVIYDICILLNSLCFFLDKTITWKIHTSLYMVGVHSLHSILMDIQLRPTFESTSAIKYIFLLQLVNISILSKLIEEYRRLGLYAKLSPLETARQSRGLYEINQLNISPQSVSNKPSNYYEFPRTIK